LDFYIFILCAFDNVFLNKKTWKNKKNVKKRKKRDLNKKRKNVYYIYGQYNKNTFHHGQRCIMRV